MASTVLRSHQWVQLVLILAKFTFNLTTPWGCISHFSNLIPIVVSLLLSRTAMFSLSYSSVCFSSLKTASDTTTAETPFHCLDLPSYVYPDEQHSSWSDLFTTTRTIDDHVLHTHD